MLSIDPESVVTIVVVVILVVEEPCFIGSEDSVSVKSGGNEVSFVGVVVTVFVLAIATSSLVGVVSVDDAVDGESTVDFTDLLVSDRLLDSMGTPGDVLVWIRE